MSGGGSVGGGGGAAYAHGQRHVVEQRPEHVVGEAVVVALRQRGLEEDWDAPVLGEQPLPHRVLLGLGHLDADPADPQERHLVPDPVERRDKPPRRLGERPLALLAAARRHRKPIRHNEHPPRHRRQLAQPRRVLARRRVRLVLRLLDRVQLPLQVLDLRDDELLLHRRAAPGRGGRGLHVGEAAAG